MGIFMGYVRDPREGTQLGNIQRENWQGMMMEYNSSSASFLMKEFGSTIDCDGSDILCF